MNRFADRLSLAILDRKNPACVGLDPRFDQLPPEVKGSVSQDDLTAVAATFTTFCRCIIDVVAPLVPVVKPQAAFFEELGPAGLASLGATIDYATEKGLLVIVDGKRNDIGSTAAGYARAYLGSKPESAWGADALTVSPYLGDDSLTPFAEVCEERSAGIFVLVKTSNPGGGTFQDLRADGQPLYQHVAQLVNALNAPTVGSHGYGDIGAVVGATYPEQLKELRAAMPQSFLLIPGYGAQGGGAADVAAGFDERGLGAVINSSRGIIFAHLRKEYQALATGDWQRAVEQATLAMINDLQTVVKEV